MWREDDFEMLRSVWSLDASVMRRFFRARQLPQPWNRPVLVKVVLARTLQQKQFWGRWEFAVRSFFLVWCFFWPPPLTWRCKCSLEIKDWSSVRLLIVSTCFMFRLLDWPFSFLFGWVQGLYPNAGGQYVPWPVFLFIGNFLKCNYLILILQFLEVLCFLNLDLAVSVR